MEYIIGSLITIASMFVVRRMTNKLISNTFLEPIRYSQTNVYDMLKPFIGGTVVNTYPLVSQAKKHNDDQHVRVVLAGYKAYWIIDNTFFEADQIDGRIDKHSAKPVDTMAMDDVQLKNIITIVEALTEGSEDESWNSGN